MVAGLLAATLMEAAAAQIGIAAPTSTAYPNRLVALQDVYPNSEIASYAMTPDSDYALIAEGGSLSWFDLRAIDINSSTQIENFLDAPYKQTEVSPLGVIAAEMAFDPEIDLSDDDPTSTGPSYPEDANDLLYIAGGHFGLWVMEAHPGAGYANRAFRLDDSGNSDETTQGSERFCNGVEFVDVGDRRYLVACFGKKENSRLRFYDLEDVRDELSFDADNGLGVELPFKRQAPLKTHPLAPVHSSYSTDRTGLTSLCEGSEAQLRVGQSYLLDVVVQQNGSRAAGDASAYLYCAMSTDGIARVHVEKNAAGGMKVPVVSWGPVFGDAPFNPYSNFEDSEGNNAWGQPAARYGDVEWIDLNRHECFKKVTRRDRPMVVDLAIQQDASGEYLYAAADHLGWMRFDVANPADWGSSIPIEHHEGVDVRPNDVPSWDNLSWTTETVGWDQPMMRPFKMGLQSAKMEMLFCREVEVVQVERVVAGVPTTESVLVTNHNRLPFGLIPRGRTPGSAFDQDFLQADRIPLLLGFTFSAKFNAMSFTFCNDIGVGTGPSHVGYLEQGGDTFAIPMVQDATRVGRPGSIVLLHGTTEALDPNGTPALNSLEYHSSCLSFFDLEAPVSGSPPNTPYFLRTPDETVGRFHFGIGYSKLDPNLLITSFSDSGFEVDGILTAPVTTSDATGPDEFALTPLDSTHDDRFQSGTVFEQEGQWVEGTTDQYIWGQQAVVGGTNVWEIRKELYTPGSGGAAPTVTSDRVWQIPTPYDRWRREKATEDRPEYMGGSVFPDYDAYCASVASTISPEVEFEDATSWVFATRGGACDGVQVIARNLLADDLAPGGLFQPSGPVPFPDPRRSASTSNPWRTFQLDTHPEWANFEGIEGEANWGVAQAFWKEASVWTLTSRAFPPKMMRLAGPGTSVPDHWVLAVPCGHVTCPPDVGELSLDTSSSGNLALPDLPAGAGGSPSAFDPPSEYASIHRRGLVQLFDVTNPWQLIADSRVTPPAPSGAEFIRPVASQLDPLVLGTGPGDSTPSSAFIVETLTLTNGTVLLFVADFGGAVSVFDVTDALQGPTGSPIFPDATWVAPQSFLNDNPCNIRAIAVEEVNPATGAVMVYAGAGRNGLFSIPFIPGSGFETVGEFRVKTAGEAWGMEIRPGEAVGGTHSDRVLIVSDAWGGVRLYGLGTIGSATGL